MVSQFGQTIRDTRAKGKTHGASASALNAQAPGYGFEADSESKIPYNG